MRQRHIKQATIEHMQSLGVLTEPSLLSLDPTKKIHLEIGSGKGQFISKLAQPLLLQDFTSMMREQALKSRGVDARKVCPNFRSAALAAGEVCLIFMLHITYDHFSIITCDQNDNRLFRR